MEQHDLTFAQEFARDQGRSIAKLCNHPRGQGRIRLRHHLRAYIYIRRNRQAKEGAVFGKWGQLLWGSPAHRTTNCASAGAQAYRHQRILTRAADITRSKARSGKTHQQSARCHPFCQLCLLNGAKVATSARITTSGEAGSISTRLPSRRSAFGCKRLAEVVQGRQ